MKQSISCKVYIAEMTTDHFYFDAYGHTPLKARQALRRSLDEHAKRYRLAPNWFKSFDIETRSIELDHGYRDREGLG